MICCKTCQLEQEESNFELLKTGTYRLVCKACRRELRNARNRAAPEKVKAQRDAWIARNENKFRQYHAEYRAANAETIREKSRERWKAKKEERAAYRKAYQKANPEKIRQQASASYMRHKDKRKEAWKRYFEANRDRIYVQGAAYREANRETIREKTAAYYEGNRWRYVFLARKRYAMKAKATPCWFSELDEFVIGEAYRLAEMRKGLFGFAWHVDHVIPLQGRTVCGLHVHNNIAVIPAAVNLSKKNKF